MRRILPALLLATLAAACARNDKNPDDEAPSRGPHENAVVAAAVSQGIDSRVLLSAAFVQSNFATDMGATGQIPGVTRTTPFGLHGNAAPDSVPQDLATNARTVAKAIREAARASKPTQPFDWLRLTAQVIVGAGDSSPLASFQVRLVLNELIATYNEGFVTTLPESEVVALPPAPEPIDVAKLDPERAKVLAPGAARSEYGTFWNGAGDAENGEKYITEMPKIILRWCPASALVCFDHLRYTTESPSHLMAYRGASGDLQFIQLHPLKKDLAWYGSTAFNSVTVTLTGLAGDKPENFRPEWMTWSQYASLQQTLRRVLQSFASFLSPDALSGDISRFILSDDGTAPVLASLNPAPEGRPKFALPVFWDKSFFAELMAVEKMNAQNLLEIKAPPTLATFPQNEADFAFKTMEGVTQLSFFTDRALENGEPWELIRRSALRGESQEYRFQEQFVGAGILDRKMRLLRVVARNEKGQPVGMKIVRFRLLGL